MTRHQDSIKARLAPKLRLLAVSPTVSEIKLNQSDLSRVRAVECGATAPQLPPSLWHFLTVQEVRARALAQDRIIDLVATVVHHGRWERQACSRALQYGVPDSPTFLTGQYWVRLWLEVRDHTSAAGLQVKVYPDRERWEAVAAALPGQPVILTNLLYKLDSGGRFSHLETSAESQVFTGPAARDARFAEQPAVTAFREATEEQEEEMRCVVEEQGSYGGQMLGEEVRSVEHLAVLGSREEVVESVDRLGWRVGARLRVEGRLGEVVEGCKGREEGQIFPGRALEGSLVRRVAGLAAGELRRRVEGYCQLGSLARPKEAQEEEQEVEVVRLHLADCHLVVLVTRECREQVVAAQGREVVLYIDLFRLLAKVEGQEVGEGVEALARGLEVKEAKRKASEEFDDVGRKRTKTEQGDDDDLLSGDEESNESDWSVHTQDLVDCFT